MNIGHRLANLREKKGLSQAALADKIGKSQSSIAMWETNKRRVPDDALKDLADFYGVTIDYLMGRDVPRWATEEDVIKVERFLDEQTKMTLGGEELSKEKADQVRNILRGALWEELEKQKGSR